MRELYKEYAAAVALSDKCREREERYMDVNDLKQVRPPVLIFEIPWEEFDDDPELRCENESFRGFERDVKRNLFQWKHFQGDHAYMPYTTVGLQVGHSGYGLSEKASARIKASSGSEITSREFIDQLSDESCLDQLKFPVITYDKEGTDRTFHDIQEMFGDILPARKHGVMIYQAMWDIIPTLHGVENVYYDLYDRPEFMHALAERFTQIFMAELDQYESLNILETAAYYSHCTPALVRGMRHKDFDTEKIALKDVWFRGMAQMFGSVSPAMTDEFVFQYVKRCSDRCGQTYFGCCEPLHNKIDFLRERFPNLRRISVTPWADLDSSAEQIGRDYVLSFKANPAFVAGKTFDPAPVEAEITHLCEVCLRYGCPFEIVLKDISTVSNNWHNLEQWEKTVNKVVDRFF